jgi:hypothetical protein
MFARKSKSPLLISELIQLSSSPIAEGRPVATDQLLSTAKAWQKRERRAKFPPLAGQARISATDSFRSKPRVSANRTAAVE